MKTSNRIAGDNKSKAKSIQTQNPAEKSAAKVRGRARANRGEVILRLPKTLKDHVRREAFKEEERPDTFMVNAIRERVLFGSIVDLKKKMKEANPVQPGSEQYVRELAWARRITAQFYNQWRMKNYAEAVEELAAFGCAIQHHPELQPIVQALQELSFAEDSLEAFYSEGKAMSAAGRRSALSDEERAARGWFESFYQRVRGKDFWNAQLEFGGFSPWIKGQGEYSVVSAALAQFLKAADVLENFLETVQTHEGIKPLEEQGGAR